MPKFPKTPKTRKPSKSKKQSSKQELLNPWDACRKLTLRRSDPFEIYPNSVLDSGVNFFVLMLEQLGARTEFSCEGHPDFEPSEFYVVFNAPVALSLRIRHCGFFRVELEGDDRWSIRCLFCDLNHKLNVLRFAAIAWEREFGILNLANAQLHGSAAPVQ